ncbi:MAG: methionyl-tRNA formyltransferase [Thermodesulfovibrio sp.]|nr:methionyl-tRNA formyltransferase [Thermodesulfovibrio sp.]
MRIIFFGTPAFAVPSLRILLEEDREVAAVVTQPDRLKGRGHILAAPPVKDFALALGIPVLQPDRIRSDEFLQELRFLQPDVIVVVAYGRILPAGILGLPPLGCINVHGSLLPKYRGAAPIQWSLINGDPKTGITTMLMNQGLDTGDILLQEETIISDEDTTQSLSIRLSEIGATLLMTTLDGISAGAVSPVPQNGEPSFAPPLSKEDGKVDWSWSARRIFNLIRGTFPWPGAYGFLNGERISILRSSVSVEEGSGESGTISVPGDGRLLVQTGNGLLSLEELKPEGRKAMASSDFVNGRRLRDGMCFDAV